MTTPLHPRLAAAWLCVAGACAFGADDASKVAADLFGDRIKAAMATPSKADDAELAKAMLAAAASAKDQPALAAAIAEKVAEFTGRDHTALDTTIKALDLAASFAESEKQNDLRDRAVLLRHRAMASARGEDRARLAGEIVTALTAYADQKFSDGDTSGALADLRKALPVATSARDERVETIRAKIDAATQRIKADQQIESSQTRLLKDGGDAAALEDLIQACVVELDDPSRARPVLSVIKDEAARRLLTIAGRPLADLKEAEAKDLGDWYHNLAQKARPGAKHAMNVRAHACYEAYLKLHGERDLQGKTARIMVNQLAASIKESAPNGAAAAAVLPPKEKKLTGQWKDLTAKLGAFDQWRPTGGSWSSKEGRIRGEGDSRVEFKHELPQDFLLEFKVNVVAGMRPRIFFGGHDFSFANEGFAKTIWVYGGGMADVKGAAFNYANGKEMAWAVRFEGQNVSLAIDGKTVLEGKRKAVRTCTLDFRGGDGWSPGTTEFYDFRLSPVK